MSRRWILPTPAGVRALRSLTVRSRSSECRPIQAVISHHGSCPMSGTQRHEAGVDVTKQALPNGLMTRRLGRLGIPAQESQRCRDEGTGVVMAARWPGSVRRRDAAVRCPRGSGYRTLGGALRCSVVHAPHRTTREASAGCWRAGRQLIAGRSNHDGASRAGSRRLLGVRVPGSGQLEVDHGSIRSRSSPVKSVVLRVASVVPRAVQIAAIMPSSTASGRPAARRSSCNRA